MRTFAQRVLAGVAASVCLATALAPVAAAADTAFTITDTRIVSPGGMATDVSGKVYWTANANESAAYAINPDGSVAGKMGLNATMVDVEALAWNGTRLYIGDIGDATGKRANIKIYSVDKPAVGKTMTTRMWLFGYHDGKHNATTLLIGPTGSVLVVTQDNASIYKGPPEPAAGGAQNWFNKVADAPADITDGTYLANGQIVLRSASTLYLLDGETYALVAQTPIAEQPLGSYVTQTLDGSAVLLGSKASGAPVFRQEIPGKATPSPSVPPFDITSIVPSITSVQGKDQTGTLLAILGAFGLSTLAAVVVLLKR